MLKGWYQAPLQLEKSLQTKTAFLIISTLLAFGITFFLYSRVISIPFYSDDLLQIPWARTAPLDEIWRTLNPFVHFRPVQFSLWRLWQWLAGDLSPAPLRFFNLVLHAGSGILTGWLAYRFSKADWFAGLGSTILCALFPFSYDAILWVSSAAYPLAVFLGLLSIHSWINFSRTNRPGSLIAALACALASSLSLESGILVGISLVALDWLWLKQITVRRLALALSASIIPFLVINFLTPTPAVPFDLTRIIQNGAMVAQASTFPVSYLLVYLPDGLDPALLLWVIGALFLASVLLIAYRSKKLQAPLLFALFWIALWGVIPAVTQTYVWDRDPPRAFYPCAVGIALVWGLLLSGTTSRSSFKNYSYQIILSLALLVPLQFNIQMAKYYEQAGQLLQQVLDSDLQGSSLYVNLPERIGPQTKTWLLGYEGVIPMPPPTDEVALLLNVNEYDSRSAQNKTAGVILNPTEDEIGLAGRPITTEDLIVDRSSLPLNIFVADYETNSSRLVYLGQLQNDASSKPEIDYLIEDYLSLSVGDCDFSADSVQLELHWSIVGEAVPDGRSIFVHLWQGDELVDQADGQFLAGLLPLNALSASENFYLTEKRELTPTAPPPYKIGIGLYNPADGERSPAQNAQGDPVQDNYIMFNCDSTVESQS